METSKNMESFIMENRKRIKDLEEIIKILDKHVYFEIKDIHGFTRIFSILVLILFFSIFVLYFFDKNTTIIHLSPTFVNFSINITTEIISLIVIAITGIGVMVNFFYQNKFLKIREREFKLKYDGYKRSIKN